MAERSAGEDFGKLVLGGAVGFALYLVATGLGFGTGRGSGTGTGPSPSPTPTPPQPTTPAPFPKDTARLAFVMTGPTTPPHTQPMTFQLRGDLARTYLIDDLVARVKAGGRSDVSINFRGDVLQGAIDAARAAIKHAGLQSWEEAAGAPKVVGSDRGLYR